MPSIIIFWTAFSAASLLPSHSLRPVHRTDFPSPFRATLPPTRHRLLVAQRAPSPVGQGVHGLEPDDPVFQDELFLKSGEARYGAATQGAGVGYCSSYKPFEIAGNHSRAVLLLDLEPPSEVDLCALADRIALSCECVALAPFLRGGTSRWPRERLAAEAWAAAEYLNGERGAEALTVVALGGAGVTEVLGLLAEGVIGAHAAVALCPAGDAARVADAARAARELSVPLLAVCGTAEGEDAAESATQRRRTSGRAYAAALREALSLNQRLAADYFVAALGEGGADFLMAPRDAAEAKAGERAIALVQGWVDRYCPEALGSSDATRPQLRL